MDTFSAPTASFKDSLVGQPYHILVVDDSPTDLLFLLNGLSEKFAVSFASSAEETLNLVNRVTQPDIILLDVMMPNMDGFEICTRLKNNGNTKHIPVIFVSSLNATADKTSGFNVGAVDYITKPLDLKELEVRIQTHIRIKEQSQYFESMAFFDPLTNVANRRKYNEVLQREWARCIRYYHQISMIIIDIDFFKQYNDTYGHAEGDNCLISVARLLEVTAGRQTDIFARIGGEEFVLLVPDCNTAGAVKQAEQILRIISTADIPHENSYIANHLTVSLGVATMYPSKDNSALSLFQAADDALFSAKRNGRNQFVIADVQDNLGHTKELSRQDH